MSSFNAPPIGTWRSEQFQLAQVVQVVQLQIGGILNKLEYSLEDTNGLKITVLLKQETKEHFRCYRLSVGLGSNVMYHCIAKTCCNSLFFDKPATDNCDKQKSWPQFLCRTATISRCPVLWLQIDAEQANHGRYLVSKFILLCSSIPVASQIILFKNELRLEGSSSWGKPLWRKTLFQPFPQVPTVKLHRCGYFKFQLIVHEDSVIFRSLGSWEAGWYSRFEPKAWGGYLASRSWGCQVHSCKMTEWRSWVVTRCATSMVWPRTLKARVCQWCILHFYADAMAIEDALRIQNTVSFVSASASLHWTSHAPNLETVNSSHLAQTLSFRRFLQ